MAWNSLLKQIAAIAVLMTLMLVGMKSQGNTIDMDMIGIALVISILATVGVMRAFSGMHRSD